MYEPIAPLVPDVMLVTYGLDLDGTNTVYVELSYHRDTPYSVFVCFGQDITWEFSRDLLVGGLRRHAGIGDVRTWTVRDKFHMLLSNPIESTVVVFPADDIREFVNNTCRAVPLGSELRHFNVDDLLKQLDGEI